jgi:hypothetical protein
VALSDLDPTEATARYAAATSSEYRLTHWLVDDLLSIHHRRLGLADVGDRNGWGDDMIETLVEGGNGYRLHEPLRRHSTQTRRIVERIEEIGRALTPPDLFGAECGDASSRLDASNVATMRSVTPCR